MRIKKLFGDKPFGSDLSRLIHKFFWCVSACFELVGDVIVLHVAVVPTRCTGCRVCELVCSVAHEGVVQPSKARIQVVSFDETVQDVPIVCQQCADAPCMEACPQDAISRDPETTAVVVDRELCIQCGACVRACVIGGEAIDPEDKLAIRLDDEAEMPLKCDLCDGDPQCVRYCPTKALVLTDTSVEGEFAVDALMVALEYFLKQVELPLPKQEGN
ncbi:MAG: 4Fe-4S dicluster domain-containing protein [Promethearchaeota archaeon]